MPRIYTSASNPLDFCLVHYPKTEQRAFKAFGNRGDGPDGRGNCFGYDAEHPPYEDGEIYHCFTCKRKLTEKDN
jgi:hypothetical protein